MFTTYKIWCKLKGYKPSRARTLRIFVAEHPRPTNKRGQEGG